MAYKDAFAQAMQFRKNPSDPKWRELYKELDAFRVHGPHGGERGLHVGFEGVEYGKTEHLPRFVQDNPLMAAAGKPYEYVMRKGEQAMETVEFYNRVPLFLYYKNKGYDAAQAAVEVMKRQFDYKALTPVERKLLRRSFLFYSFTKNVAPLMAGQLLERPGGAVAQTLRGVSEFHDQQVQPIPKYIQETAAIPLGERPDGSLSYLTGFGLPMEDVAGFFPNPVEELLSRTTPLIKAPAELAFGRSLFQRGRPLEDLDPNIGRTIANIRELATGEKVATRADPFISQGFEFAVANSPLSRALSSLRTLTDTRKGLLGKVTNLATGARIVDVSEAAQDAEIGQRAAEVMKRIGGRSFVTTYVPKEEQANLSQQEMEMLAGVNILKRQRDLKRRQRALAQ